MKRTPLTWLAGLGMAAVLLWLPAAAHADVQEDFSELLRPLKPVKPILPPTAGCAACEKLGHICSVCKERALRALAEGREIPEEPPKVLPEEHPTPAPRAARGHGENPLVPVAKMMKDVEGQLKDMADKDASGRHQDVLEKVRAKQLELARRLQKELTDRMDRQMDQSQEGQKRILQYLDDLIAQAEEQQGSGSGSGQGQGQGKGGSSGPPSGVNQPSNPATVSALPQGGDMGIGALRDDVQRGSGESWLTQLPLRRREAIIAAFREQFPDTWREQLERYYRVLSELRRQDRRRSP